MKTTIFSVLLALSILIPGISHAGDCEANGVKLHGRVKVVDHFGDLKVQVVDHFPDLKVKKVSMFPDNCGEWQFVSAFPDFTIQFVDHFPDIKIKYVDFFPGED